MLGILRDLIVGIVAGIMSGIVSGWLVYWLLSRRVPKLKFIGISHEERFRITIKNVRRKNVFLGEYASSSVQNIGELHIVISIVIDDPAYSHPITLVRNDPMIIKPEASFVFVSHESSESIWNRVADVRGRWSAAQRNVDNMGIRFRMFSRDGFSGAGEMVEKKWEITDFSRETIRS